MANKHDYPPAYYDGYASLTASEPNPEPYELNDLDDKTKRLALDYLISGANKGDNECKWVLGHHYMVGLHVEKDTVKGRRLMIESGYWYLKFKTKANYKETIRLYIVNRSMLKHNDARRIF